MKMTSPVRTPHTLLLLLSVICLACSSCANPKSATVEDDKWKRLAEQSKGYSPSQTMPDDKRLIEVPQPVVPQVKIEDERPLNPHNRRVTLKLHEVDLPVMIQALAMAAEQPILMNAQELENHRVSINVKDKPWDNVFLGLLRTHGLFYVWEGKGDGAILRVVDKKILDASREMDELLGRDMTTSIIKVNYLNLGQGTGSSTTATTATTDSATGNTQKSGTAQTDIRAIVESVLSLDKSGKGRGKVMIDSQNNAIILTASREDTQKALEMVKIIDKPRPQIRLAANIVETTKEMARALGVQWAGNYNPKWGRGTDTFSTTSRSYVDSAGNTVYPNGLSAASGAGQITNFPTTLSNIAGGSAISFIYGTIGGDILEMQLSALQQDNKLNILSSPTITTMDNVMAYTENGERVPYLAKSTDSSGKETTTVNFENAVMRLEITPHVIDETSLKLNILVKKDEVDSSRSVSGNPYIIKKQTETQLIVGNRDTIVISGLTKQTNYKVIQGIPGLKDVPGLGWLFKAEDKSNKMEEVLIFITPEILGVKPVAQLNAPQDPAVSFGPDVQGKKLEE